MFFRIGRLDLSVKEGRSFSVNVLKKGQQDLADHYGRSAGADKLAFSDWTNDRLGLPLLRKALAWFACQVVSELPAGDHVLVVGKVFDGTLVDSEAEPMCYRETGAMDGASKFGPKLRRGQFSPFKAADWLAQSAIP